MPDKQYERNQREEKLMKSEACPSGTQKSVRSILAEAWRFFKTTPYAISVIWRFEPRMLLLLLGSTVLDGISPTATVWMMRYFLDAIVKAFANHGESIYLKQALWWCAVQLVLGGGFAAIAKGLSYWKMALARKLSLSMQTDLIHGMSRLEMRDYDNPKIYDMIARARGEAVDNKPLIIVTGVGEMISSFITWVSLSALLLAFSPLVVLGMFAICIPYFILNVLFAKANFNLQFSRTHEQRVSSYLASCFMNRRSLPEVITLDLWSYLLDKWNVVTTLLMRQDLSLLGRRTLAELGIIVLTFSGRGAVSIYIVVKCLEASAAYTVGQLTMYIQAFLGATNALTQVTQQISMVYEGSCFLMNYQNFQALSPHSPSTPAKQPPAIIETIECRGVGFTYPGATTCSLENINLIFRRGQSTLLVGRNGAGKTTLARLLVGLYAPTRGQILINGSDMREFDAKLLRKKMTIIFQDYVRYALTAAENIGVGCLEHIDDQERIVQATKAAHLDDVITRLPNGYNTILGKEFRDGQDLSLGEWQRVCLARLFMRDASVMIYDEPSASLDVETESELLREINVSGKKGIGVLISHRMLRADIADRVIVLEKGRVIEQGNHDQLVALDGRYATLWKAYHRLGSKDSVNVPELNAIKAN